MAKRDPPAPMTLQEIADVLGCSRERVRQIERDALKKLRKALLRRNLTYEDLWPDRNNSDLFEKTLTKNSNER